MASSERITLADDAAEICNEVVGRHIRPETRYQHGKVGTLVSNISEQVVKRLNQQCQLPRKYVVHVLIMQKVGAGFCAISSCSWDSVSDACYVHQSDYKFMTCIVTVYGVTL